MIPIPTAMSFTRGCEHSQACNTPRTAAASPAHITPSHGPSIGPAFGNACDVRYDTPNPAIAPITSVPSCPRLIRPLRSVSVSPRLTKMNGVLFRIAPAKIARGTPQYPNPELASGVNAGMNHSRRNSLLSLRRKHPDDDPRHP